MTCCGCANTSPLSRGARASAPAGARDLVVDWVPIETLIPYARNARTHSDAQVAQIAGSIKEFGFTNPILCDEAGGRVAGSACTSSFSRSHDVLWVAIDSASK